METGFNMANIGRAMPEMYLAGAICFVLLVDVFFGEKRRGLTPTLTLLVLAVGAALTLLYANLPGREFLFCLLYTSDAADARSMGNLGWAAFIKKKK